MIRVMCIHNDCVENLCTGWIHAGFKQHNSIHKYANNTPKYSNFPPKCNQSNRFWDSNDFVIVLAKFLLLKSKATAGGDGLAKWVKTEALVFIEAVTDSTLSHSLWFYNSPHTVLPTVPVLFSCSIQKKGQKETLKKATRWQALKICKWTWEYSKTTQRPKTKTTTVKVESWLAASDLSKLKHGEWFQTVKPHIDQASPNTYKIKPLSSFVLPAICTHTNISPGF